MLCLRIFERLYTRDCPSPRAMVVLITPVTRWRVSAKTAKSIHDGAQVRPFRPDHPALHSSSLPPSTRSGSFHPAPGPFGSDMIGDIGFSEAALPMWSSKNVVLSVDLRIPQLSLPVGPFARPVMWYRVYCRRFKPGKPSPPRGFGPPASGLLNADPFPAPGPQKNSKLSRPDFVIENGTLLANTTEGNSSTGAGWLAWYRG